VSSTTANKTYSKNRSTRESIKAFIGKKLKIAVDQEFVGGIKTLISIVAKIILRVVGIVLEEISFSLAIKLVK